MLTELAPTLWASPCPGETSVSGVRGSQLATDTVFPQDNRLTEGADRLLTDGDLDGVCAGQPPDRDADSSVSIPWTESARTALIAGWSR